FPKFVALAGVLEQVLELDDGRPLPRTMPSEAVTTPPGYWFSPTGVGAEDRARGAKVFAAYQPIRLGGELWCARRNELSPPLSVEAACQLLGMSVPTLRAAEDGGAFPRL